MQDKIGVFVSIVSTKIPFKGTGKEYIGDDITEISSAVKVTGIFVSMIIIIDSLMTKCLSFTLLLPLQTAIQQCCVQLKSKIVKKLQARERQERKRNLTR